MKTINAKTVTLNMLAFGLVLGLQACGGGSSSTAAATTTGLASVNCTTDPICQAAQTQQNQYGNVFVQQTITINNMQGFGSVAGGGTTQIGQGTYSWQQMYQFLISISQAQVNPNYPTMSPLASTNLSQLQYQIQQTQQDMVTFQFQNQQSTLFAVLDWFIMQGGNSFQNSAYTTAYPGIYTPSYYSGYSAYPYGGSSLGSGLSIGISGSIL